MAGEPFEFSSRKGLYAIEGIDGLGKSTIVSSLRRMCVEQGKDMMFTKEPSGSSGGLMARSLLEAGSKDDALLAFLFASDRFCHVYGEGGVLQTLSEGRRVFTDRYLFSSMAYQGRRQPTLMEVVLHLNSIFPLPEVLFFLSGDAKLAVERRRLRGDKDIESAEDISGLAAWHETCLKTIGGNGTSMKIVRLDATRSPDDNSQVMFKEIFANDRSR